MDTQPIKNLFENKEYQQPQVVSIFALVGFAITGCMGVVGLFNQSYLLASALLLTSAIFFLSYFVFKKYNKIALSSAICLYVLFVLMLYLVFTGGVDNTGPLWMYIVPPVAFFFHGLKRGLIEVTVFILACIIIMFMPTDFVAHIEYPTAFKLRLIYSFLTVTFLSALYEYSRAQAFNNTVELGKKYQLLAHLDSLTELSNRRDALFILKREQSRVIRNKEPLSIILCDVDFFKKVNDHYGHNAGDAVLIELAKIFTNTIREQDCVARWGGEEFLFILPQTTAKNAFQLAEKIQIAVENYLVEFEEQKIRVTVSMGIEQSNGDCSIDEIINNADKYLYQAKNAGRNSIFPKY